MKFIFVRIVLIVVSLTVSVFGAAPQTEFYIRSGGSNLNAGSTNVDAPLVSYTSSMGGAGWTSGTGVFTVASGDPVADGVAVGMFASVYVTSGATKTNFVGLITARTTTTITVSVATSGFTGTPPATDASGGLTSMVVGGAWVGPSNADAFPIDFVNGTLSNNAVALVGASPRINIVTSTFSGDFTSTATWATGGLQGPVIYEACSTTAGDLGTGISATKWVIDGGATGTAHLVLSCAGNNFTWRHMEIKNNGNSGSGSGMYLMSCTGADIILEDVYFHDSWGTTLNFNGQGNYARFLEQHHGNKSSTANQAGVILQGNGSTIEYFYIHDNNANANTSGVRTDSPVFMNHGIVENSGSSAIRFNETSMISIRNVDIIGCVNGLNIATSGGILDLVIDRCNIMLCSSTGILAAALPKNGYIGNIGYGSGTFANGTNRTANITGLTIENEFSFPANTTPYRDYANKDFTIISPLCIDTVDITIPQAGSTPVNATRFRRSIGAAPLKGQSSSSQ